MRESAADREDQRGDRPHRGGPLAVRNVTGHPKPACHGSIGVRRDVGPGRTGRLTAGSAPDSSRRWRRRARRWQIGGVSTARLVAYVRGYRRTVCPKLVTSLAMASSAVGTVPKTSRWRVVSATDRPVWNQSFMAAMSLTIGTTGPSRRPAVRVSLTDERG